MSDHPFLLRTQDLNFMLNDWLDIGGLCRRERYAEHDPQTFASVLALAKRIAEERFAPHARLSDQQEPVFSDGHVRALPEIGAALEAQARAGFVGATLDYAVGGSQLPHLLDAACTAWFSAANLATQVYGGLTSAAAALLSQCASPAQVATWVPPMAEGRFLATMCLTESQAGSSVGDIVTKACDQGDGTFRVFGSKMWIGAGDHQFGENIVHLVLARTADAPAGTPGLSLFIVPKWLLDDDGNRADRNDVVVAGINHKMGQRGTVNTVLSFGEGVHLPGGSPGAVGYLIGREGDGLAGMFHMMNHARVSVGIGSAALGYAGYLRSLHHARGRLQGRDRDTPADHPQQPIIRHADVRRMLLAQKCYVEGGMALVLYVARLLDDAQTHPNAEDRERARSLADLLTPIAKSWPAQWCFEANSLAIQIHGGYGYARDHDVERLFRDNRLSAIYEGTTGVLASSLMRRHVLSTASSSVGVLLEELASTARRGQAAGGILGELARSMNDASLRLGRVTDRLRSAPEASVANATIYLQALGHVVVGWIWLEQALATLGRSGDFYKGKRLAAQFFHRYELPRTNSMLNSIANGDRTTLVLDEAWF